VQVRHHRVAVSRWPAHAPSLRIAFVSDLHAGPTTHPTLLDEAFDKLGEAAADIILFGGDYVFLSSRHIAEIEARLARLCPRHGMFGVLGNHDLWADDREIVAALERGGVRVLVNERIVLPAPYAHVTLFGKDDPWTGIRSTAAPFVDDDQVRIVLVHAPEGLLDLGDHPFELAICGHTHGGHVALPGGIPIVAPGPLSRRYAHGRHQLTGDRSLIVSRGIGGSEVALRLNADPDILVIEVGQ
jgi:uncharacterized protein